MLDRMKRKGDPDKYTFSECCLFVLMVMGTGLSILGMLAVFMLALLAAESLSSLVWLIPCGIVAVVCCAGLMYVLGGNGDYGRDGDDDEY